MGKRKSTRDLSFDRTEAKLEEALCTLTCVAATLDGNDAVDGDEIAARARTAIHCCVRDLEVVRHELDVWHVTHDHKPKEARHG